MIKATLNKAAFRRGDKEEMKKVQIELKEKIAEGKECYRRNIENIVQRNNLREVRNGKKILLAMKRLARGRKTPTSDQRLKLVL